VNGSKMVVLDSPRLWNRLQRKLAKKVKKKTEESTSTHVKQLKNFEAKKEEIEIPEPRLNWMGITREWGVKVLPGEKGLTLGSLNVGVYGEIPTTWSDRGRNPRGAIASGARLPLAISVQDKADLWANSAATLYEEAIQRRWIPATDIPWDQLAPLPDDIEHAICQVCTELMQYANTDIEVITNWQHKMAYGYHEVKQYLATASFDGARRYEAFRKRALSNGGGLGLESTCQVNRVLLESTGGWTETVATWVFNRLLFALTICRYLERFAYNEAEIKLYQYVGQDLARILSYGIDHLHYAMNADPEKRASVGISITIGDAFLVRDLRDPVLKEALSIIFGAGINGVNKDGLDTFYEMLDTYVKEYLELCAWLKLDRKLEQMPTIFQADKRKR